MALFKRRDIDQYTDSLAQYLPGGILFASKNINSSNFRKLLKGMAGELFRSNGILIEYSEQILPDQTVKFIEEWEKTLGIPDDCFNSSGSLNERRRDILVKLAALGVQTAQDFINLATIFGITVVVVPGVDEISLFTTLRDARFTIVVNFIVEAAIVFPLVFPIPFASGEIAILECLFTKLKPANCNVIFQQV